MPTHKIYSKYAGIGNDILQTNRISLKAKGLLGYLISKPEGWDFSSIRIADEIKESKKTIQSILRELESDGLLIRERLANGRILYHVYSSYELLKEPEVDNDSEQELLRAKMGHISKQDNINKKEYILPKKKELNSKNSLTPCTQEEIESISEDLGVRTEDVGEIHQTIMDKIDDGVFQQKKYGKTVYFTLRAWARKALREGRIKKKLTNREEAELYWANATREALEGK